MIQMGEKGEIHEALEFLKSVNPKAYLTSSIAIERNLQALY